MWLATLITMLVVWNVQTPKKPHYPSMAPDQTIAYISDIGAQGLKPLFITGCVITSIFLDLSLLTERWLRHSGRLAKNQTMIEKVVSWLSILAAAAGTVGLIGLSVRDTLRYPTEHVQFLAAFIIGYVISAIFVCWEYQRLGIRKSSFTLQHHLNQTNERTDFREHRILRSSFWIKLFFIIVEIALAIAFAVTRKSSYNTAAILEWAVSFIFTFYVFSFFIDLIPAIKTRGGRKTDQTAMQMEANDMEAGNELDRHRTGASNMSRHSTRMQQALYEGDGSRIRGQRDGRQGGTHQGTAMNNYEAHPEPQMAQHSHHSMGSGYAPQRGYNGTDPDAQMYSNGNAGINGHHMNGHQNGHHNKPYPAQPHTNY